MGICVEMDKRKCAGTWEKNREEALVHYNPWVDILLIDTIGSGRSLISCKFAILTGCDT